MLKKILVLTLTTSLITPALADNWLGKAQTINQTEIAARDKHAVQHHFNSGKAKENQTVAFPIELKAGKFYAFMADCDYECEEAKLSLTQNGKELASMFENDNSSPMFGYKPKKSGTYKLEYTITDCEKNACDYSVQVFEGDKSYNVDF